MPIEGRGRKIKSITGLSSLGTKLSKDEVIQGRRCRVVRLGLDSEPWFEKVEGDRQDDFEDLLLKV